MKDHNHENSFREDRSTKDRRIDDLDRVLDAALAKYAAVEPRPGLEDGILANVRTGLDHAPHAAWWRWGLTAAIAALVLVVVTLAWRSKAPHPQIANRPPVATQSPTKSETPPIHSADNVPPQQIKPIRRAAAHRVPVPAVASSPKLDQFPSPQPLSPEEIALARYVRNFPNEAQLVAKAQEELEVETQRELNTRTQTRISGSIEQER